KLNLEIHHGRYLKTYVDNLNNTLKNHPKFQNWTLEQLVYYADFLPCDIKTSIKHNAGGVYNHNFYFSNLTDKQNLNSFPVLKAEIEKTYLSFDNFKKIFKNKALSVFGSGYTYFVLKNNKLDIINLKNQNTPLSFDAYPLISIDLWEHAYYLKHYNFRAAYIDDWFNVVNYEEAEQNYIRAVNSIFIKKY
ncbi:MAG: superoxide dismutase, partial [Firmicutes bacterium]|nr:superoxide dismutase [Bacillota bacterium]